MREDILAAESLLSFLANTERTCFNILGVHVPKQRRDRACLRKPSDAVRQPRARGPRSIRPEGPPHVAPAGRAPNSQWASYTGLQAQQDIHTLQKDKKPLQHGSQDDTSGGGVSDTTALHHSDGNTQSQLQHPIGHSPVAVSRPHCSPISNVDQFDHRITLLPLGSKRPASTLAQGAAPGPKWARRQVQALAQTEPSCALRKMYSLSLEELQAMRKLLLQGLALHLNGVQAAKAETQLQLLLYYLRFHGANPQHLQQLNLVEIVRQLQEHHNRTIRDSAEQLLHVSSWCDVYNLQLTATASV